MILLSVLNWIVTAIIWLLTPLLDVLGLYALIGVGAVATLGLVWGVTSVIGRAGRRRPGPP
jgi:hypothetical protein